MRVPGALVGVLQLQRRPLPLFLYVAAFLETRLLVRVELQLQLRLGQTVLSLQTTPEFPPLSPLDGLVLGLGLEEGVGEHLFEVGVHGGEGGVVVLGFYVGDGEGVVVVLEYLPVFGEDALPLLLAHLVEFPESLVVVPLQLVHFPVHGGLPLQDLELALEEFGLLGELLALLGVVLGEAFEPRWVGSYLPISR